MPITTRSTGSSDETSMDLATLTAKFLQLEQTRLQSDTVQHELGQRLHQIENQTLAMKQQLDANTHATSNNTHAVAMLDRKLDNQDKKLDHQFREIMAAFQQRNGGSAPDGLGSSNTGLHNPDVQGNPRGPAIQFQDAPLEQELPRSPSKFNLPRVDFPVFTGIKPSSWVDCCNFYFDMYQVPEEYKSRMAVMHFKGPADDWYRCFKIANPQPPWPILVEEVMNYFAHNTGSAVDEFKRVHQSGSLEEYITNFLQARARLTYKRNITSEDFYVEGFVSGLKEQLRHTIELFNLSTVNDAIRYARQIELSIDSTVKKASAMVKTTQYQTRTQFQTTDSRWKDKGQLIPRLSAKPEIPKILNKPNNSMNLDQKRVLGLCFKCDEK